MFRPLELYAGLKYTRAKRRNHFISFISSISMGGIALAVMLLITVLSVMNGFEAELRDLIRREAEPSGTLLISHIREAISVAAGERDHVLVTPAANVECDIGEVPTFGDITWS